MNVDDIVSPPVPKKEEERRKQENGSTARCCPVQGESSIDWQLIYDLELFGPCQSSREDKNADPLARKTFGEFLSLSFCSSH